MAYIPSSGSIVAIQSNPSLLQATVGLNSTNASVITVGSPVANQSVSGRVETLPLSTNASVITVNRDSIATVIIGGSIAASFTPPANQSVSGTVGARLESTNASVISYVPNSVATVIIGGSIAASFTPPANQSVSGTVQGELLSTSASIITVNKSSSIIAVVTGSVAVSNFPATQVVAPNNSSLFSLQPAGSILAVSAVAPANQSVSGTVHVDNFSSVISTNVGSIITVFKDSSIIAVSTGSIAAFQGGTWNVSVVGQMATTSSVYQVLSSITTISIMNANANRKAGAIFNSSGTMVFVKLGTAANTSVYTVAMAPNDLYELPGSWTGVVAGISNSTAGIINVTELT